METDKSWHLHFFLQHPGDEDWMSLNVLWGDYTPGVIVECW